MLDDTYPSGIHQRPQLLEVVDMHPCMRCGPDGVNDVPWVGDRRVGGVHVRTELLENFHRRCDELQDLWFHPSVPKVRRPGHPQAAHAAIAGAEVVVARVIAPAIPRIQPRGDVQKQCCIAHCARDRSQL